MNGLIGELRSTRSGSGVLAFLCLIALSLACGVASASAAAPSVGDQWATDVHSDTALVNAEINAGGEATTFQVEYGPEDCSLHVCTSTADASAGSAATSKAFALKLTGLAPGTTYYYRFLATNTSGPDEGSVHTFTTFPFTAVLDDPCSNAHVRQQTSAALLPDCRAYELVSAADTGGYNVESTLVPGQDPFGGYPDAGDRVLYGIHSGAIPGVPGVPTNRGVDPYVAVRSESGWTTSYAGLPADNPFAATPFSSTLLEADAGLQSFAFGGPEICSPCFADGWTGVPLRLPGGDVVQGMDGAIQPATPATEDGLVRKRFSADGTHFLFSSTSQFESEGNDSTGDVSIYDRDLVTGETQVVSTDEAGAPLTCPQGVGTCHGPGNPAGIAALDVSEDGSRIVVGRRLSTDADGNHRFHLYMHLDGDPNSVDLTPGAVAGAQYAGMTADGSSVFLTTADQLVPVDDTDTSADLYEVAVDGAGVQTPRLVSTEADGIPSNDDGCEPVPNSHFDHWNSVGGLEDCGAVAIGGGGGVSSDTGHVYFLSPEVLDSSDPGNEPVPDAPNLYLAQPGSGPHFVTTLESSLTGPPKATILDNTFDSEFGTPRFVAVDNSGGPSHGDIYVADIEENVVRKFDPSGNLITSWGEGGVLSKGGPKTFEEIGGIAVRADGTLYVQMRMDPFEEEYGIPQYKYAEDGTFLGVVETEVGGRVGGGVVVDSNGFLYKIRPFGGLVVKITPSGEWDFTNGAFFGNEGFFNPVSALAIDPADDSVYLAREVAIKHYSPNSVLLNEVPVSGTNVKAMAVDPTTGNLYLNEGDQIRGVDPSGSVVDPPFGVGVLSGSTGVAVSSAGAIYATNPANGEIVVFKKRFAADPRTDHPLVVNSVTSAEKRFQGDFQVTPDGRFAVFGSTISLLGHDNARHQEIYRYDASSETLECASCNPTGARAVGGSALAPEGLSLDESGRVFFDSDDVLAARDLDGRRDVYLWSAGGVPQLISAGMSRFDSRLLGAGPDGGDVYFFTRDTLANNDENGSLVRLYDARAGGGFPYSPPPVSCKASDECHGPGSEQPATLEINTVTGYTPSAGSRCRKGQVKRRGRCVKKARKGHRNGKRPHHTKRQAGR
jgi:hypothetical protein